MASLFVRLRLFLSSYAPLIAIVALRSDDRTVGVACLLLALSGLGVAVSLIAQSSRLSPSPYEIVVVKDRGAEVAGYLATYLLPFLTVGHPTARDLASYVLFGLVIGVVYVQSDMVAINPLLYMLGFKVSAVTTSTGYSFFLISTHRPRAGEVVLAARLAEGVLLGRGTTKP